MKRIVPYNAGNEEIYNLYKSIVFGYTDPETGVKLQPLYDIGSLSSSVQIYVSLKNNNIVAPSEDTTGEYWGVYFKNDPLLVQKELSALGGELFRRHVENYHLGELSANPEDSFVNGYLKKDMSNIPASACQKLQSHTYKTSVEGFDYVKRYVHDKKVQEIPQSKTLSVNLSVFQYDLDLSAYVYVLKDQVTDGKLSEKLSGTINFESDNIQTFINTLKTDEAFAAVKFKLSSSYMTDPNYPALVEYKDYDMIAGIKGRYSVSFMIGKKETSNLSAETLSAYYVQCGDQVSTLSSDPISSASRIPEYPNYTRQSNPVSSWTSAVVIDLPPLSITGHTKWFREWNSGYLEHGGVVDILSAQDLLSVRLDWTYGNVVAPVYDYPDTNTDSFYGLYKVYDDVSSDVSVYNSYKNLGPNDRYVVELTPLSGRYADVESGRHMSIEATQFRNDSFGVKIPKNNTVTKLQYYVSGYKEVK